MLLGYWYEYRPYRIKKSCSVEANEYCGERFSKREKIEVVEEAFDFIYKICLRRNGL